MLYEALFTHAAKQADEAAITDDHGAYTYGQLAGMAASLAKDISAFTARPRVGLLLPSGVGFVASFYGALLAGKTAVPLNFLLGDGEIAHCVRDSDIDTVLTIPQLAARVEKLPVKIVDVMPLLLRCGSELPAQLPSTSGDDVAVLMYTSGTGGLPKGVPLTYTNLQSDVDAAIAHVNFQRRHKFLGIIPLFHAFGMTAMMLAPIQLGASIVYMGRFNPVAAVSAIKKHGISLVLGVPSMYAAIFRLKEGSAEDFKSIHAMISGGEPLPAALREGFHARFGVMLLEAYGMTETSLAISTNTPESFKPGSVGKPIPGIEVAIEDEAGRRLSNGEEGEICIKGPMVMRQYHNLPFETAASFTADGYFKTGDIGKLDSEGFLHITGRKKELIIIAGEKASPREIEEVLVSHPGVAEAAVIGKKDASRGEAVLAFIVPREGHSPGLEELREFCRKRGLAAWKVPKEIRILRDLPHSPTGKVLKRVLAQDGGN
jgi:long-chain acyl-CoA synthetase